jgi:hypothetical protein
MRVESSLVVAVICEGVHVAAEAALEDVFGLDLDPFGAFADLVADLCAVVADVVLGVVLGKLLEEFLRAVEVLLDEDLGVVVCAFGALLAVAVHVVPAKLSDDVLKFAHLALETEPHVEVRAALVNVTVGAVFPFLAFLPHEVRTNLQVVAEIALVSVPALAHALELIAWLDFAFVVGVGAIIGEPALAVDELLAYSVGGQFVVVRGRDRGSCALLGVGWLFVQVVIVVLKGGLRVHLSIIVKLKELSMTPRPISKMVSKHKITSLSPLYPPRKPQSISNRLEISLT